MSEMAESAPVSNPARHHHRLYGGGMNMTTKISNAFFVILVLAGSAACNSTQQQVEDPVALASAPPPEFEIPLPLEQPIPMPPEPPARICQLGTSCLTMDPRPFEPCLLTTRHCPDTAKPMLVGPPHGSSPAPPETSR
jgi:hypothetical protein